MRITSENLREFATWDTSIVWKYFPAATDILTIHNLDDKMVPPKPCFRLLTWPSVLIIDIYNATIYARALGAQIPGTHNLHIVEYADHNFTEVRVIYLRLFQKQTDSDPQHRGEVFETILLWWETRRRGGLKTGLWPTGVPHKL